MDIYAGLTVLMLSLGCGAFPYAHEARPYALVLGAVSMTMFCYAIIVEEKKNRAIALVGIWFGVAIIVGSHWFGCLALVPLILGELVRSWQRRKVDVVAWLVLTGGAATTVLYLPLLKAASAYRILPWKDAHPWGAFEALDFALEPCLIPLAVLMIAFAVVRFMFGETPPNPQLRSMPAPVFTCVVGLSLISFPGFLFGKLVTHVFLPRYVLFCTIGLLVLITGSIYSVVGTRAVWRIAAFSIIAMCVLLLRIHDLRLVAQYAHAEQSNLSDVALFSPQPSIPIVLSDDAGLFLRIEAHAPSSLRQRCLWVTDPGVVSMTGQSTTYLMIEGLRKWTRDPISDLSSFLTSYHRFYLISDPHGWIIQRMIESHA